MFDLIWAVFIIILLCIVSGIFLMFKKFFASKIMTQSADHSIRVEPDLHESFDENRPQSVFNVRKLNKEPLSSADIQVQKSENFDYSHINASARHLQDVTMSKNTLTEGDVPDIEIFDDVYLSQKYDHDAVISSNTSQTIQMREAMKPSPSPKVSSEISFENEHYETQKNHVQTHSSVNSSLSFSKMGSHGFFQKLRHLFTQKASKNLAHTHTSGYVKRPRSVETIALILLAPENDPYSGAEIFSVVQNFDLPLTLGKEGFLDQMTTTYFGEEIEFSIASLVHPGSFDVPNVMQMEIPGILFFMDVPTPDYQRDTFDQMLKVAARFGNELGGTLLNHDKRPLTAESVEILRQYIVQLDEKVWFQAETQSSQ